MVELAFLRLSLRNTGACILLGAAYFLAAELALFLSIADQGVTLFWPAAGVAVAALLLFGGRLWPGVVLGILAVNAVTDAPFWFGAFLTVGYTLQAVAAFFMLTRLTSFSPSLRRISDIVRFLVFGAALSAVASASVGVFGLWVTGLAPWAALGESWLRWWLGDAMGVLLVAPLILAFRDRGTERWTVGRVVEGVSLIAGLLLVGHVVFADAAHLEGPLAYLMFPFPIWAALRFGLRGAVTAIFLVALFAVWGTATGVGPFAVGGLVTSLAYMHGYLAVVAVLGMVLAVTLGRAKAPPAVALADLERTAAQRTAELARANAELRAGIEEREKIAEQLKQAANFDAVTGLPTRRLVMDRLTRAIARAKRRESMAALFFIDLDGFKDVNDRLGHDAGDALLKEVGRRLSACVREIDTVARFGGDEFMIVMTEVTNKAAVDRVAEQVLGRLSEPFSILGQSATIGASIGIAIYPDHGKTAETLVRKADEAMYKVKDKGKKAYRFASR